MTFPQVLTNPAQANWPLVVNANGDSLAIMAMYGKKDATTSGLTLGFFGGHIAGTTIADGTTLLAASQTNYVVAHRTTGAVTDATDTTNWDDTSVYGRIGVGVTSASAITTWTDWREQDGGWFDKTATAGVGTVTHTGALTANAVVLGNGADDIKPMASLGTTTTVLHGNAAGAPTFAAVSLTADVTGTLPVANGGTGVATLTAFAPVFGGTTGTGAVQSGTAGTAGQVLTSNGAGVLPTFQAAASGSVATDTIWDAAGDLVQGTGANTAARLALGTALQVLRVNAGATAVEWGTAAGDVATDAIWDAAGDIVQGTGANTAAKLSLGTALQQLRVNAGATALEYFTPTAGSTQGRHAIFIHAGSIRPSVTGGCQPVTSVATTANQPDVTSVDFDTTTQEYAQFFITMPKSWDEGTVTFAPIWSHAATTTNFGVVFDLQGYAASNDDAIATAYGTAVTSTDTGGTTNDLYMGPESAAMTIAGTPAAEDTVFFRISRVTGNGSDTMAIDARLMGIVLYITTNADTDA